jgi:hypothetical protein
LRWTLHASIVPSLKRFNPIARHGIAFTFHSAARGRAR